MPNNASELRPMCQSIAGLRESREGTFESREGNIGHEEGIRAVAFLDLA